MKADNAAVALSGGGVRAGAFALGAVLYLVDSGASRGVASCTSVSGGGITNGLIAAAVDLRAVEPEVFVNQVARPLARRFANGGFFLLSTSRAKLYTSLLVACGLGILALVASGYGALGLLCLVPYLWLVVGRRSHVASGVFQDTLFQQKLLRKVDSDVTHVFCATELQSGRHVYFAPHFVAGWDFGKGSPKATLLADVVQASAAYPFGFPPRFIDGRDLGLKKEALWLTDGGVYDNMADQFATGFVNRVERIGPLPGPSGDLVEPDFLLVVNASVGRSWQPWHGWPIVREFTLLARVIGIFYDNTTAQRRRSLVREFDRAAQTGEGMRGALVHIGTSPPDFLQHWAGQEDWPARQKRAKELLLDESFSVNVWAGLAEANAEIGTVLTAIGRKETTDLIWHSYKLTQASLYVLHGWPLPNSHRTRSIIAEWV